MVTYQLCDAPVALHETSSVMTYQLCDAPVALHESSMVTYQLCDVPVSMCNDKLHELLLINDDASKAYFDAEISFVQKPDPYVWDLGDVDVHLDVCVDIEPMTCPSLHVYALCLRGVAPVVDGMGPDPMIPLFQHMFTQCLGGADDHFVIGTGIGIKHMPSLHLLMCGHCKVWDPG